MRFLLLLCVLVNAPFLFSQDPRILPVVQPKKAVLGETILFALDIKVRSDGAVAAPTHRDLPTVAGVAAEPLEVLDRGTSRYEGYVNGRVESYTEYHWQVIWKLTTERLGTILMPSFEYGYLGKSHRIRAVSFQVLRTSPGNRFAKLVVTASDAQPYVNEPVTLRFSAELTKPLDPDQRPRVSIPWARSASGFSGKAPEEGWAGRRRIVADLDGKRFEMRREVGQDGKIVEKVVFERTIYPIAEGRLNLGASTMTLHIATRLGNRGVFGRQVIASEKAVLRSEPLILDVRGAPMTKRPPSYTGVIGEFECELKIGKTDIRAGDGVTMSLNIEGRGELETLTLPVIDEAFADFDVYPPGRRVVDGGGNRRRLEVAWLLVPKSDREVTTFPKFAFSWFRPSTESFETTEIGPASMTIRGETEGGIIGGPEDPRRRRELRTLGEGVRPIKYQPGQWGRASIAPPMALLALFFIGPLLLFVAAQFWVGRRRRLSGDVVAKRRGRASKEAKTRLAETAALIDADRGFHGQLARAIQGFVSDKLDVPSGRVAPSTAADIAVLGGADSELGEQLASFLEDLEAREFGATKLDAESKRQDLSRAESLIRDLDRSLKR